MKILYLLFVARVAAVLFIVPSAFAQSESAELSANAPAPLVQKSSEAETPKIVIRQKRGDETDQRRLSTASKLIFGASSGLGWAIYPFM